MNALDDRLEVVDRERVRVEAAVPADDVEGMVRVGVAGQTAAVAHDNVRLAATVDGGGGPGPAQVAFPVRGALEELAVVGEVPAGWATWPRGLDDECSQRFVGERHHRWVVACGDDDVVAGADASAPNTDLEDRLSRSTNTSSSPAALRYSELGPSRLGVQDAHVVVGEQELPAADQISRCWRDRRCGDDGAAADGCRPGSPAGSAIVSAATIAGGRVAVVEQRRRRTRTPPGPSAPRLTDLRRPNELGMALRRDVSACNGSGARLYRLPRRAWSRSMASNSALKLPSPKPVAPSPLDDLEEHRRAVGDRLGEDLQQVAVLVAVDQDVESRQVVPRQVDAGQPLPSVVVVGVGHAHEPHARVAQGAAPSATMSSVRRAMCCTPGPS